MGQTQSNRNITIEKDEMTGIIKLSDSVIHRLKGEFKNAASTHEKQHKVVEKEEVLEEPTDKSVPTTEIQAPAETSEQPRVPETQSTPEVSHGENVPSAVSAPAIVQQQPQQRSSEPRPYEEFMEEAHLTALKIRKDKESEIRNIEEYWRNQLSNLTNEYERLRQLAESEFHASVSDVKSYYAKESFSNVCSVPKEEVLNCYLANKEQPLNCSEHVKHFKACAEQFRLANLAPKSNR